MWDTGNISVVIRKGPTERKTSEAGLVSAPVVVTVSALETGGFGSSFSAFSSISSHPKCEADASFLL